MIVRKFTGKLSEFASKEEKRLHHKNLKGHSRFVIGRDERTGDLLYGITAQEFYNGENVK